MHRLRRITPLVLLLSVSATLPASAIDPCPVPSLKWGTTGSGPGEFVQPAGVAVTSEGKVYVTDQGNERVQVFDGTGAPITQWAIPLGSNGRGSPTGICVDNGVVWVTSNQGQQVSRWTTAGGFLGFVAPPPLGWEYPTGVTADASGNIYVCNLGHTQIVKLDSSGSYLGQFYSCFEPYGIDIDAAGNIYVGCYSDVVVKYDSAGHWILSWGSSGAGPGQFNAAEGIMHDASGNIFVCDAGNDRVQAFTPTGTYLCEFGGNGTALGQMDVPGDIAIGPGGDIFVCEYGNNRIQRFTFGAVPTVKSTWGSVKTRYR